MLDLFVVFLLQSVLFGFSFLLLALPATLYFSVFVLFSAFCFAPFALYFLL